MYGNKGRWKRKKDISKYSIQELPLVNVLQKRNEGAKRIYGKRIHESRAFLAEI